AARSSPPGCCPAAPRCTATRPSGPAGTSTSPTPRSARSTPRRRTSCGPRSAVSTTPRCGRASTPRSAGARKEGSACRRPSGKRSSRAARRWKEADLTGPAAKHAPMGGRAAGYLLLAPFLVVFAVFGLLPMLFTAWVSLHDWHLLDGPRSFTGTGNYLRLLSDWRFYNALGNTVSIFLLSTVVQLLAALGLAALLNRPLRAATWWRAGVLLPNVVSVVAVALVFGQLFGDTSGTVNAVLQSLGLDPVDWHGDRLAAHLAVSVMVIWRWTGYNALLYLAAMQSIPQERYD